MVFSYQIMAVVVGWHLYRLTHDPLALGLVGLAEIIPYFCSALFAGYAVDHYSKRNFAILSSFVLMLSSLTLAAVANEMITAYPTLVIYASICLVGLGRAFIAPSYSSIFAIILPRKEYGKASGIGSSVFQIGLVSGPALGGVLVGWTSITIAYLVAASFALLSALPLIMISIPKKTTKSEKAVFAGIAEAIKFVVNHQVILSAQALDMFAVLLGGAVAMLPAFIHDIYQIGPEGLGILRSAPAIGAIMTGIYLARNPIRAHAGQYLLWAVTGFGVCIIAFGLTTSYWLAAFILMLSGVFDGVSVILRTTIMQLATPDEMRGRVAAINGIFIGSSNELGAFESGVTARLFGLVPSVVIGGLMTLGVVATTAKLAPNLRRLDLNQLEELNHSK
jgi:MFS family permease